MAEVKRGSKTAGGAKAARAVTREQREAELVARRPRSKKDEGVQFRGNTDHLWAYGDKPIFDPKGNAVGVEKGLFIEFLGGRTKTLYPERYRDDADFVRKMDEWIASGDRTVEKYDIRRVEPDKPQLPFDIARWDLLSAKKLRDVLEVLLGDDFEENKAKVAACIAYEEEGAERPEILAMLGDLLGDGDVEGDALDAEFTV